MNDDKTVSLRIDDRLEQYRPFFDSPWAEQIDAVTAGTKLADAVFALSVNWRAAANTCAMPWLMCQSSRRQWTTYLEKQQPFSDSFTAAVTGRVAGEMVGDLSKAKQKKLVHIIQTVGDETREQADEATLFRLDAVWRCLLDDPEFQLAIWGSQRIGYGSIYHAYEHFVRGCIALASGNPSYRGRRIHALIRDAGQLFGPKIAHDCLASQSVMAARLVRNALAHNGGRETVQLRGFPHGLVVEDNVVQVMASDTRGLFDRLKIRAYKLARQAVTLPTIRAQ
ncbi:MAG: hypothetical protein GXY83_42820 [Rhodopirellula sp.]|nr:hypothetical protein [Rhodopirellula sp.]